MTDRERLVALIESAHEEYESFCEETPYCNVCKLDNVKDCLSDFIAERLISNGVTLPVRCGECKFGMDYEFGCGNIHFACVDIEDDGFIRFASAVDRDEYCGRGERRADNG